MGADLVGGHTITCGEGERHIDYILELAARFGVRADFHLDESGNRENYLLPYTARRIKELGLEGRVNGIHMCTLAALTAEERAEALRLIADAGMTATIAPTAISTRHIAPVKELLSAGVPVALGSDNIRDFFNPLGSGDVKQVALLLSYLQRFFTAEDVDAVWRMVTSGGAAVLGIEDYGHRRGRPGRRHGVRRREPDGGHSLSGAARAAGALRSGGALRAAAGAAWTNMGRGTAFGRAAFWAFLRSEHSRR